MPTRRSNFLLALLLAYAAASLFHHVHNATFLNDYPNMPAWLTPAGVYGAWLGVSTVGLAGYLLLHHGYRRAGLVIVAIYGAFGLYGLLHYTRAPLTAHTLTMNLTVWLEVITAVLLLLAVTGEIAQRRGSARGSQ